MSGMSSGNEPAGHSAPGDSSLPPERQSLLQAAQSLRNMYQDLRHVHDSLLRRLEENQSRSLSPDDLSSLRPNYDAIFLAGSEDLSDAAPPDFLPADALDQAMARLLIFESTFHPPSALRSSPAQYTRRPPPQPPILPLMRRLPPRQLIENDDFATTSIGRAVSQRETASASPSSSSSQPHSDRPPHYNPSSVPESRGLSFRREDMPNSSTAGLRSMRTSTPNAELSQPQFTGGSDSMASMPTRRLTRLREQRRQVASATLSPSFDSTLSTLSNFSIQNLSTANSIPPSDRTLLFEEPEPMTAHENEFLESRLRNQRSDLSPVSSHIRRRIDDLEYEQASNIMGTSWDMSDLVNTRARIQQRVTDLSRSRQNVTRMNYRDNPWVIPEIQGPSTQHEGAVTAMQPEERRNAQGLFDRIRRQIDHSSSTRPLGLMSTGAPRVRLNGSHRTAGSPAFDPDGSDFEANEHDEESYVVEMFGSDEPFYPYPLPISLQDKNGRMRQHKEELEITEIVHIPKSASMAGR